MVSEDAERQTPAYREQNPEVFYHPGPVVTAGPADIAFLKEQAARNPRLRCRLCTHGNISAPLHEMLIVHHHDIFVRPHMHIGKSESLFVIEGRATALFFDAEGTLERALRLGDRESGLPFYYRIPERTFHALIIESEWLVFHEVNQGPFDPSATISPPWGPQDDDPATWRPFVANLAPSIEALLADGR